MRKYNTYKSTSERKKANVNLINVSYFGESASVSLVTTRFPDRLLLFRRYRFFFLLTFSNQTGLIIRDTPEDVGKYIGDYIANR
jgi:hypothetical protein